MLRVSHLFLWAPEALNPGLLCGETEGPATPTGRPKALAGAGCLGAVWLRFPPGKGNSP